MSNELFKIRDRLDALEELIANAPPPEPNHSSKQVQVLAERLEALWKYRYTSIMDINVLLNTYFDSDGKAIIPDAEGSDE